MDGEAIARFIQREGAFSHHCGVQITRVEPEQVTAQVEVVPVQLNAGGSLHGGMYFILADAAATALCMTDGRRYVTADSDIRFLRGTSGGVVLAKAVLVHRGRRSCVVRVDLTDQAGGLLAVFTGSFTRVGEAGQAPAAQ